MAPTIFFRWRRNNRKSSTSTIPSCQPGLKDARSVPETHASKSSLPLPTTSDAPASTATTAKPSVVTDARETQSLCETLPEHGVPTSSAGTVAAPDDRPSLSSISTMSQPSLSDYQHHLCLDPGERTKDSAFPPQSDQSGLSFAQHDQDDESYKSMQPLSLSATKGLLSTQVHVANDGYKKPSTPKAALTDHSSLLLLPPNGSHGDMQKDCRLDTTYSRRYTSRDSSAEHLHHRSGKAMMYLLNPVSLLAKRRSPNLTGFWAEDISAGAQSLIPEIPDGYDPRIRGNIIHDFSTPRLRRNASAAPYPQGETQSAVQSELGISLIPADPFTRLMGQKKRSEYSPIFREHFDDDKKLQHVESMSLPHLQLPLSSNHAVHVGESTMPISAGRLLSDPPEGDGYATGCVFSHSELPSGERSDDLPGSQEQEVLSDETVSLPCEISKHLESDTTRFSFDMNAVESSAQEKYLEDKHKEKEAVRKAASQFEGKELCSIDDDYNNIVDDAEDIEERIPGVNVDADEESGCSVSEPGDMINRPWLIPSVDTAITTPDGFVALTEVTASTSNFLLPRWDDTELTEVASEDLPFSSSFRGISSPDDEIRPGNTYAPEPAVNVIRTHGGAQHVVSQPFGGNDDDDDLYFDDGEFGDLGDGTGGENFDESVFDDETSHLYSRKPVPRRIPSAKLEGTARSDMPIENGRSSRIPAGDPMLGHAKSVVGGLQAVPSTSYGTSERTMNIGSSESCGETLTEFNLEALHNALAKVARDVARAPSVSEHSASQGSTILTANSHRDPMPGSSYSKQSMDTLFVDEEFENFRYDDDDDDALYDDPIIAAANAEALENDDEGFYGEEFGFYAEARGNCSPKLINGGYFGPRSIDGVAWSCSTRGKACRPSLTPITERSERSTRNSIISLTAHGTMHPNPVLSGTPLAPLVGLDDIGDEMPVCSVMNFQRGTFEGSNESPRSSSTSPPPRRCSPSDHGGFAGLSDTNTTGLDCKTPNKRPSSDPGKEKSLAVAWAEGVPAKKAPSGIFC